MGQMRQRWMDKTKTIKQMREMWMDGHGDKHFAHGWPVLRCMLKG